MSHLVRKGLLWIGLATLAPSPVAAADVSRPEVERAVADVRVALARDGGALWGMNLMGPLLFVDPETHRTVGTHRDSSGLLAADGSLFAGTLPTGINVANREIRWGGLRWSMVRWPLPSDSVLRRTLIIHELWHRVQADLGFPVAGPANTHLDSPDGRLWLALEWRALSRALEQRGEARRQAVGDALAFRAVRRRQFPGSAAEESALERHEGLAEYTGVRLASETAAERASYARAAIARSSRLASFVRSFAYVSGPAYGLLLDDARPDWRVALGGGADLGELLRVADRLPVPDSSASAAEPRGLAYGLDSLRSAEREREQKRQERLAGLRARYVSGPTLRLPLTSPNLSFDPNGVQPLDTLGTVYVAVRITERWGILDAPVGALIDPRWSEVTVPAPTVTAGDTIRGPGWTLTLQPGWEPHPATKPGSWAIAAKK